MNKNGIFAAIMVVPLALAGCATLNEDQCQTTDWYALGNANGASGKTSSYINQHVKACSKYGIVPDQTAWRGGWELGIRTYCTPQNGLEQGREGRFNNNACPAALAFGFNEGFRIGQDVYDAEQSRDELRREIDEDIIAISEAAPKDQRTMQLELEIKRNRLFDLQNELNSAERRADLYSLRRNSDGY